MNKLHVFIKITHYDREGFKYLDDSTKANLIIISNFKNSGKNCISTHPKQYFIKFYIQP